MQDIRAKRKLDRLQLLDRSRVTVNRDGRDVEVVPEAVVRGDAVHVRPGDQLVVDGPLLDGGRVDVDESLLTGESEPLHKLPGDDLLSGRFCVGGEGHQLARDVGAASYASRLTADARQVPTDKTPLQNPIEFVLRLMSATILFCLRPPTAPRPPGRCRWDRAALDPSAVDVAETRSPTRRAASTSS
ncbi:P-type ATPase [Blastococcus sp. SYSU DS0973]